MWTKWLPWRMVITKVARAKGFIDPVSVLSHLHRLAQPSEVTEPVELLRAGLVLHARGLINTGTIQHNLDWVWPYWVERQFDPRDPSFIPRAFSITHVNLTHRNWTAVGIPDCPHMPIVDPRGLVTPLLDSWSVDGWLVPDHAPTVYPSREKEAEQRLCHEGHLAIETETGSAPFSLTSRAEVIHSSDPICQVQYSANSNESGWLVVSLRPTNPEGVSFIHQLRYEDHPARWFVDGGHEICFSRTPDRVVMSNYRDGDVARSLDRVGGEVRTKDCDVGLVTAAAMFRIDGGGEQRVSIEIPLRQYSSWAERSQSAKHKRVVASPGKESDWADELAGVCQIETPNEQWNSLFRAAVASLILHSPGDVFPGPYTYKRFWFRDAAFILNGLLAANLPDRVGRVIERFPDRQSRRGYFHSQEGEWDSNGEAIWIIHRYSKSIDKPPSQKLLDSVIKGARWIAKKKLGDSAPAPHAGLMPAGFSAEHLGHNDFYFWDDFWSIAGLQCAADLASEHHLSTEATLFSGEAVAMQNAIDRSLELTRERRNQADCIPAAPSRRMDAGAIGSLAGSYPLQIWNPNDHRMLATVEYLLDHCMVRGGFFQDMIHSGINPYLTLHLAQVLLRSGSDDAQRSIRLTQAVADLASPTGQWPEAVHPITLGGCMGDGQHIWAAAEWLLMMRNLFVREERDTLFLGSGLPREWLNERCQLKLGPTLTIWGQVTVQFDSDGEHIHVHWEADWHQKPTRIVIAVPGTAALSVAAEQTHCLIALNQCDHAAETIDTTTSGSDPL